MGRTKRKALLLRSYPSLLTNANKSHIIDCMDLMKHDCKQELRKFQLKVTPARLAVLSFLEKVREPVDVTTIIQYLGREGIQADQATIFRIVNLFTGKGLTRQVQFNEGKFRYELSSREDHHHLICERCGKIEDISDCSIKGLEKEITVKKQFLVKRHSLEFFGVCKECQS